jgi:HlyD family secretion protein
MRKVFKSRTVIIGSLMLLIVLIVIVVGLAKKQEPTPLQGQVEVTDYRVSSKVITRVVKFLVTEGQHVHRGDTLVVLRSPELDASMRIQQAAYDAQRARQDLIDEGSRSERIRESEEQVRQAQAHLDLAEATYKRVENLYREDVASQQRRDEAWAAYQAARARLKTAQANREMVTVGARKQERQAAAALTRRDEGQIEQVQALLNETVLTASEDGVVTEIFPEVGEMVGLGAPIMNIDTDDWWFTFFVKEDQLPGVELGKEVDVYVPGVDKTVRSRVSLVKNLGDFAAWKATRALGEYDLKVFEVQARPLSKVEGIRKEMSAVLKKY